MSVSVSQSANYQIDIRIAYRKEHNDILWDETVLGDNQASDAEKQHNFATQTLLGIARKVRPNDKVEARGYLKYDQLKKRKKGTPRVADAYKCLVKALDQARSVQWAHDCTMQKAIHYGNSGYTFRYETSTGGKELFVGVFCAALSSVLKSGELNKFQQSLEFTEK